MVVGAGFSGLVAAYEMQQAGFKTAVLEARNRVGGRIYSIPLRSGPGIVEMGATLINEMMQPNVFSLTQKFGLGTADQYTEGDAVFQSHDGKVVRHS